MTIERYLRTHAMAGDSITGVTQWWLGNEHPKATQDEIEQALALLVDRGRLRQVSLADGTTLYASSQLARP